MFTTQFDSPDILARFLLVHSRIKKTDRLIDNSVSQPNYGFYCFLLRFFLILGVVVVDSTHQVQRCNTGTTCVHFNFAVLFSVFRGNENNFIVFT